MPKLHFRCLVCLPNKTTSQLKKQFIGIQWVAVIQRFHCIYEYSGLLLANIVLTLVTIHTDVVKPAVKTTCI